MGYSQEQNFINQQIEVEVLTCSMIFKFAVKISIVADTSNSNWFKFVKSICNHNISISSGSVFQVIQCFQVAQCFSAVSW